MRAIELNNVTYKVGSKIILDNVNLKVDKGELFFLLGKNGSGKSTIIKALLGLIKYEGVITFFNETFTRKNRIGILMQIGAVVESASLYSYLTVEQNFDLIRRYYDLPRDRIYEVLEMLDMCTYANKRIKILSSGMKQKLGIGLALLNNPKLIILDEPTNNLDPLAISDIRNLIIKLNRLYGTTFFITSHMLNEVEKLATSFGVLKDGQLIRTESIKNIYNSYLLTINNFDSQNFNFREFLRDLDPKIETSAKVKNGTARMIIETEFIRSEIINRLPLHGVNEGKFQISTFTIEDFYLWYLE